MVDRRDRSGDRTGSGVPLPRLRKTEEAKTPITHTARAAGALTGGIRRAGAARSRSARAERRAWAASRQEVEGLRGRLRNRTGNRSRLGIGRQRNAPGRCGLGKKRRVGDVGRIGLEPRADRVRRQRRRKRSGAARRTGAHRAGRQRRPGRGGGRDLHPGTIGNASEGGAGRDAPGPVHGVTNEPIAAARHGTLRRRNADDNGEHDRQSPEDRQPSRRRGGKAGEHDRSCRNALGKGVREDPDLRPRPFLGNSRPPPRERQRDERPVRSPRPGTSRRRPAQSAAFASGFRVPSASASQIARAWGSATITRSSRRASPTGPRSGSPEAHFVAVPSADTFQIARA